MAANKVGQALASMGQLTDIDSVAQVGAINIYRNLPGTVMADDAGNEYMYLLGVASTVAGSWVVVDASTFQTALATVSATNAGLVAVAMAATLALQYGWYQTRGFVAAAQIATAAANGGKALYVSGTSGVATSTAGAAACIFGAFGIGASVSGVGAAFVSNPVFVGNATI